jgi:hypothetical protein
MLSSITPLGQRGRGLSWGRTVVSFWVGAIGAGIALFTLSGLVGSAIGLDRLNPWFSLAVIGIAAVLDIRGIRPPGLQRQVNEDWLGRYRDWVTGLGFGGQLGLGFATIVPSFGTWAIFLVATSVGLPVATIVGAGYGLGRSLLLVSTKGVLSSSSLGGFMRGFAAKEATARRMGIASYAMVLVVAGIYVL